MTREYKKWKNRSTNKNEQLLKIQHYIKVRLLHDRQFTHVELFHQDAGLYSNITNNQDGA